MKAEDIKIYAETQGLYTIRHKDTLIGKISNRDMKGRWYAYLLPYDPEKTVDVTHHLHSDIEAAICEAFPELD